MTRYSIRYRLIKRLLFVLAALAITANAGLYFYLRGEIVEEYDDALHTQARAAAAVWQAHGDAGDKAAAIARAFPDLHFGRPDGHYLRIVHSDGSTALRVPDVAADDLWHNPTRAISRRHVIYDLTLPNGRAGRAVEIGIDGAIAGSSEPQRATPQFALLLASDRHEMDHTLASLAIGLFAVGGSLSAASIWLVLVVVRKELMPLSVFSEAVGRLNADSLGYRFPVNNLPDELFSISDRLNELLGRLEAAFSREKRFTGNVAHELRTPLAELRTMVEVAMKWPPDDLGRHHTEVLEVVKRMSTVAQTLLTLVRSDPTQLIASITTVDLVAHVRAAAFIHESSAARRDVVIDFDIPEHQAVSADTAILSSLLDNLFSNATLYATEGSRITCAIHRDAADQTVVLCLSNDVVDLTDGDLARLEEPFWRKDPARSSSDHVGLGLALVRSYCEALRVGLSFRLPTPDRLAVCLSFPLRLQVKPAAQQE